MKCLMLTSYGLALELNQDQALKALRFGKSKYDYDIYQDGHNRQYTFADGDRWIYEIDIFDETHPLD